MTSLLFSGSYIAGRYATQSIEPLLATLIRHMIAGVFLQLVVWQRPNGLNLEALSKASRRDWLCLFLTGTFGVVGHHFFFLSSLRHTSMANSAIISASTPVVTGLFAAAFSKEKLSLQNYSGGMMALIGILVLLAKGDLSNLLQLQFNRGDLMMVGAVVCWASYSVLIRHLSSRYSSLMLSYCSVLFGTLQLLMAAPWITSGTVSWPAILGLLYMGIAVSGMGCLLFTLSVRCVGPTKSNSIVYGSLPLCVAWLAWLFFSEPITPWMILSMGLVTVGLCNLLQSESVRPSASRRYFFRKGLQGRS